MKNNFEKNIKQALDSFEAEYNPADWSDLQNRLSKAKAGKSSFVGKGLLIAASVIVASGAIYYFSTTENKQNIAVNTPVGQVESPVSENTIEAPAIKNEVISETNEKNTSEIKENEYDAPATLNSNDNKDISKNEKSEAAVSESTAETKTAAQEQAQSPSVQQIQPVQGSLNANFRSDIAKICEGTAVQFLSEKNEGCTYKWTFGDGQTSTEQNPKHVFTEAGTYAVKLRVVSPKDKKQAEQKNMIVVMAAPSVKIDHSIAEDNGLQVNFESNVDKAIELKWDLGDKQTTNVVNPTHTYSRKGTYHVTLTAKNAAGCVAVAVKDLVLKNEIDLLAPNAFSPDGNGVNDTWLPVALQNGDFIFTLTIADKAGNVVFKTSDKNRPWDGLNAKTGDTFIWRAVVKDKNGEDSNYQGLITISE